MKFAVRKNTVHLEIKLKQRYEFCACFIKCSVDHSEIAETVYDLGLISNLIRDNNAIKKHLASHAEKVRTDTLFPLMISVERKKYWVFQKNIAQFLAADTVPQKLA